MNTAESPSDVNEEVAVVPGTEATEDAPSAPTTAVDEPASVPGTEEVDAGMDGADGSVDESASSVDAGMDGADGSVETVDALEVRLAQLENAMDQIQSRDLDGAEATITALEQQLGSVRD